MFVNYLNLAFRLLIRNRFFTFVNVVGLAIGFASFYILWEYSTSELQADQYHKDAERIARVGVNWNWTDWTDDGGQTHGHLTLGIAATSLCPAIQEDFPEVESTLRILHQQNFNPRVVNHGERIVISVNSHNGQDKQFKETKVAYADSNLFTFFSIPLVYGQPGHVLSNANDIVLSQSIARKYFGDEDPTGELLRLNDSLTLKVSGVFEDLPHYTHLNFEMVISNVGLLNQWSPNDFRGGAFCYVKLNNSNFKSFETKLNQRVDRYWGEVLRTIPNTTVDMFVQPLAEIPFSQNFMVDDFYPRSRTFLLTLTFIALSVLIMAWINYVNLSVTRTTRRFREVATRKVTGAGVSDIIRQFMTEALVTNALALALSFTLIQIVRSPVALLFGIEFAEFSELKFSSIAIIASVILTGILLSGLYPAMVSVAFQPRALFNMSAPANKKRIIPSLLIVSQFAAAIIFLLLAFTVSLQLDHILKMDKGIKTDQAIIIEGPVVKPTNYNGIVSGLKKLILLNSDVKTASVATFPLANPGASLLHIRRMGADLVVGTKNNCVDEDFIPFYELKLLAGRNFIKDDRPDAIIVSRFAAKRLGFSSPEEAIGSKVNLRYGRLGTWKDAEVIGVIENFRDASFLNMNESSTEATDEGSGMVYLYEKQQFDEAFYHPDFVLVRISPQEIESTMAKLQTLLEQQFPGIAFTWYFLDQDLNAVYAQEETARNQIILFTILALIIACLGLLGMISYKVVEKTREISIRKVLGAELHHVTLLLVNTTMKQIAISIIVGTPIAYYLTQLYLQKYSERIILQWWHFATPVLILIIIMFSTIASILWQAARTSPVDALKHE